MGISCKQRGGGYICLLLPFLLLPACTAKNTTTSLIPGKELSRSSLGFREQNLDVSMRAINPYTVHLRRKVCRSELLSIEYLALLETREEQRDLDCSDAYMDYVCHNITALGVPFVFDSLTGFHLFRNRCLKISPEYHVTTAETNEIIRKDVFDSSTAVCSNQPVAGAEITARVKGEEITITTSAKGIASLPKQKLTEIKVAGAVYSINYQYDKTEITTEYRPGNEPESQPEGIDDLGQDAEPAASKDRENALTKGPHSTLSTADTDTGIPVEVTVKETVPPTAPAVSAEEKPDKSTAVSAPEKAAVSNTQPVVTSAKGNGKETSDSKRPAGETAADRPAKTMDGMSGQRLIVRFDHNRAAVKTEFRAVLQRVADEMKRKPDTQASIEGHTDSIGTTQANLDLSMRRAAAIKNLLVGSYGIPAERIRTKWYGETRPVVDNDSAEGRALNRRSEIVIITLSKSGI